MRNYQKIILLTALVLTMLVVANNLRQRFLMQTPIDTNHIILADDYVLSGSYDSALVIVANTVDGGDVGTIEGDAALVGRDNVTFDGQVQGDLTAIGATINITGGATGDTALMGEHIVIAGNFDGTVTVVGTSLTIGEDSRFSSITACVDTIENARSNDVQIHPCQDKAAALATFAPFEALRNNVGAGIGLLFRMMTALLFTGLSGLAVTIFPRQFSHIQEAITSIPRGLAGVGCMTVLLMVGIGAAFGVLLAVLPPLALVLVPVGFLLALLLLGLCVIGWITMALLLGNTLVMRFRGRPQPPLVAAVFGSLSLCALGTVLTLLPYGWIIALLGMAAFGSMGLGGTLATRIGTRPLHAQYFVQG